MRELQPLQLYPEYKTMQEYQPNLCQECEPTAQTTYWRTFTQASLDTFIKNGYHSSIPNFCEYAKHVDEKGGFSVPEDILNTPGNLWCTPDPAFALSMGLARGIAEETDVYLLGFNYCKHDEESGVQGFKVYDHRTLLQLNHSEKDRKIFFSDGTLFNKLNPNQIANGVFSPIDPSFIQNLRIATESASDTLTIYDLTKAINTAFTYIDFDYKYIESDNPFLFSDIYIPVLMETSGCDGLHKQNQQLLLSQFYEEIRNKTLGNLKKTIKNRILAGPRQRSENRLEKLLNSNVTLESLDKRDLKQMQELYNFYLFDGSSNETNSLADDCRNKGIDIIPWLLTQVA